MFSRNAHGAMASAFAGAIFVALAVTVLVVYLGRASGAPLAHQDISSDGPLTNVYLGNELSCQVHHGADVDHEMFPTSIAPADCGTLLAVGGVLYAPDFFSHDGTAVLALGTWTPFTQVSQSGVTGSGTAADPFTVVTVADAGATGLRITQTDTHVSGTDTYRSDIAVENTSATSRDILLYRGARCFLADSSISFGVADPVTHAVGCSRTANNVPPGRVLRWSPVTPIDHYMEGDFRAVWTAIGARTNLPDTCQCTTGRTAGAAINWQRTIAPGATVTLSHLTTLSGAMPTPTPTSSPAATDTALATETHTPVPTETHTPVPTETHTPVPTETHTAVPTHTYTPMSEWTQTPSAGETPEATKTAKPTKTPQATKTPKASPTATYTRVPGDRRCADMDGDGRVTWDDVRAVLRRLGKKRFDPKYDLNGDGKITGRDVFLAVKQLGRRCER